MDVCPDHNTPILLRPRDAWRPLHDHPPTRFARVMRPPPDWATRPYGEPAGVGNLNVTNGWRVE
jgi:hypothetical protein